MWACEKGYLQVVKALLAAKARTDAKDEVSGEVVYGGVVGVRGPVRCFPWGFLCGNLRCGARDAHLLHGLHRWATRHSISLQAAATRIWSRS